MVRTCLITLFVLGCCVIVNCASTRWIPRYFTNKIFPLLDNARTISKKSGYIVGGEDADDHEFPYIVSIQHKPKSMYYHKCGGVIIDYQWVLTAAHCYMTSLTRVQIVAGAHDLADHKGRTQIGTVKHMITFWNYDSGKITNDIALIKLAKPFKKTKYVDKIRVSDDKTYPAGLAIIAGWGDTSYNASGILPSILQRAQVPIQSQDFCKNAWKEEGFHRFNFCAAPDDGKQDACNADSGGPLVQDDKRERILIGLISYGPQPCGVAKKPGVYTRVAFFYEWMQGVMRRYS